MSRSTWLFILGVLLALLMIAAVLALLLIPLGDDDQEAQIPPTQPPPPAGVLWEALFTTPQRTGTPPESSPGRLDLRLVELIDGARSSVDMAIYDLELENVAQALVRARERGVRVRVVTDTDNLNEKGAALVSRAGITIVEDKRTAIMHHKFAVIDGATVLTGSWNFAERDTYRHDNNAVIFAMPDLAKNFTAEFEKMYSRRAFGPTKPKGVPNPVIEAGSTRIATHFASQDDTVSALVQRLNAATRSIAFMAFSFTLDEVGLAMEARARAGTGVWGVIEATGSSQAASELARLQRLSPSGPRPPFPGCEVGAPVLQDGNPFLLHHKVIVIDERTVVFGSYNFTNNAARDNDETLLIVDDPALAARFLVEFCRVYNVAVERAKSR